MSQKPKVAPVTFFLGAGASRAFGYPTTKEFLAVLRGHLGGQESELLSALTEVPEISDIEHVLEILDQVTELENPFLKYLEKRQIQLPAKPTYHMGPLLGWEGFQDYSSLT